MTLDPAIGWILALSLALLLGDAAGHKLRDPARFRSALAGYRLMPEALVVPAGLGIVAAELLAAVLLVLPSRRAVGAAMAAALMGAYALAMGVNLLRGRTRIDCGCLGFGRTERIAWWMVARNAVLAAAGLGTMLPSATRGLTALDAVTVGGTVLTAALLYETLGRLASLPSLSGRGTA